MLAVHRVSNTFSGPSLYRISGLGVVESVPGENPRCPAAVALAVGLLLPGGGPGPWPRLSQPRLPGLRPAHLHADSDPPLVEGWRVNIRRKGKRVLLEIPKETDVIAAQKWFQSGQKGVLLL